MTRQDIIYDEKKGDIVFWRTESIVAWNVINVLPNSYSYTPEMGVDLDIQSLNIRFDANDEKFSSSIYSVLRSDVSTKLDGFGLGIDEFVIDIDNDIVKIDVNVSRIRDIEKREL